MLKRLHIRNYALIDHLEIEFSGQLTIVTGETGAGKSILLGALGLVMGERADSKSFYNEAEKCVVEAHFDVRHYDLKEFFTENELDYDDEVVIRREVAPAGKSRAFVNDTPVNNALLQRLTDSLLDLHLQFDTLDIHNVNFQMRMVDALADNTVLLKNYQQGYRQYSTDKKRLNELRSLSETGLKEMEFARFQYEELQKVGLLAGEQEQLEAESERMTHTEDIKRYYGAAFNHLSESEQSIIGQLQGMARNLSTIRKLSSRLNNVSDRLEAAIADLQDLAREMENISDGAEYDPQRMMEVQERLNALYKLQKKHSVGTVDELLTLQERFAQQLSGFQNLDENIATLEASLHKQEKALREMANTLSARRRAVAPDFEKRVQEMLAQLSMPHARLQVAIAPLQALNITGLDDVQFLFATNVGSRFLPIKDVASGGELSRLTLCTKSLVADAIPLPTLIFDEIDAGVSGDVSMRMGLIIKELSTRHQVVSITHTPQVAARADKHYFVFKKVVNDRTVTNVRLLTSDERVRSIAVMLSGNPPSDAAITTARELVDNH
jgi:DNA repair protein RecN (Recombination protein N)